MFSAPAQSNLPKDTSKVRQMVDRALTLDSLIRTSPEKQTSSFNPADSTSLPVGIVKEIGQTKYIICIDSAYFTPQGAFFSVYMALDFPNSSEKLAFAAKDIQFNPKGVLLGNGARLNLISEAIVNLGPKFKLRFNNDGKNFIEWDCNGYKQTGLSVDFILNSDHFINASDQTAPITASVETVIQNLNELSFSIASLDPFYVRGASDFVFTLENIAIDRSASTNPSGITLPTATQQTLVGGINSWKGFYAQSATVSLPEKLSGSSGTNVYAQHIIIDDGGLTGTFGATNVFTIDNGGEASGWAFSMTDISASFEYNRLTAGSIEGDIRVPPLDDEEFTFSASIYQDTNDIDYAFAVSPKDGVSINAFKSTLNLASNTELRLEENNDRFIPSATLHGSWELDNDKAKLDGIAFQNLEIIHTAPYFQSGSFSLTSNGDDENDLMGFGISLNAFGLANNNSGELITNANISLTIGSDDNESGQFSVTTGFQVISRQSSNSDRLEYDNFDVDQIAFSANTSAFNISGVIDTRTDDPVFGDLFYGSVSFGIDGVIEPPMQVSIGFGTQSNYKYWFVDAAAPIQIPLVSGVNITSLYGGVQNRVASTLSTSEMLDRVIGTVNTSGSNTIPFVPDPNQGLTFRAGVGLTHNVEETFNGEVLLEIGFNPNGGFSHIGLDGQAYMMVKRDDRTNSSVAKANGNLSVLYNHNDKILDAGLDASIDVPNVLNGSLDITLHVSEDDWYFWLNRPSDRANVNILSLFNANAYFMVGTQIDPIPSPPSYVTNIVGGGSLQNIDYSAASTGGGFVTGMQMNFGAGGEFPSDTKWRGYISANAGAGFDMMLMKLSDQARCSGSNEKVGINNYYALGQVYAYVDGSMGARKYKNGELKKEHALGTLSVAALLQGKLPNPTFVYGTLGLNATVLGIISFDFTAEVELGTDCNLVN